MWIGVAVEREVVRQKVQHMRKFAKKTWSSMTLVEEFTNQMGGVCDEGGAACANAGVAEGFRNDYVELRAQLELTQNMCIFIKGNCRVLKVVGFREESDFNIARILAKIYI